jgi:hypothetical protein
VSLPWLAPTAKERTERAFQTGRWGLRERLVLWTAAAGGAILVFVLALGLYSGYRWYQQRYGSTPERALQTYFTALGEAEYGVMYEMTPDADLMVLGRKLSPDGFAERMDELLGGKRLVMKQIELERLAQRGDYYYFRVQLSYTLGDTGKVTRLLVELTREGQDWKVTYPFSPTL